MSKTGRSRLLAAVLTVAASALLTGCGGDDAPTATATDGGGNNGFVAYRNCLGDHGVVLPSADPDRSPRARPTARPSGFPTARPSGFPTARPSGFPTARPSGGAGRGFPGMGRPADVDEATWQKAQEACSSLMPTERPGGRGGPDGRGGPGGSDAPDAGRDTAYRTCLTGRGVDPDGLDPSDAKVKEALTACAPVSPPAPN
ncbi:PT domain-containing protein [Micromonospora sp. WMMD975]|uniref:PT domain-containing protein n=1 Tax=Micromonospora sp. WMMD975 TaxID=3016087 RepID=UPI00249B8145|nr:PT domain-containing protein [Micromonospora sp. WMMD975]WFE32692.1 PT domain-containing protein [Micromonospora sp. WMMD975]